MYLICEQTLEVTEVEVISDSHVKLVETGELMPVSESFRIASFDPIEAITNVGRQSLRLFEEGILINIRFVAFNDKVISLNLVLIQDGYTKPVIIDINNWESINQREFELRFKNLLYLNMDLMNVFVVDYQCN